jgi:hypothetical protein
MTPEAQRIVNQRSWLNLKGPTPEAQRDAQRVQGLIGSSEQLLQNLNSVLDDNVIVMEQPRSIVHEDSSPAP